MTPEQATALRAPFPPEAIGKLPRVTCKACSESRDRHCAKHDKKKCAECGNYISTAHLHLDYVGHAGVRDRLLQVDPDWTWEPAAIEPNGMPLCNDGGLWIRMTVCGVTRYGWGDGPDIKQRISDAIRNAAMTFGVALDLWSKEDLQSLHDENAESGTPAQVSRGSVLSDAKAGTDSAPSPASTRSPEAGSGVVTTSPSEPAIPKAQREKLKRRCAELVASGVSVHDARVHMQLPPIDSCGEIEFERFVKMIDGLFADLEKPFAEATK